MSGVSENTTTAWSEGDDSRQTIQEKKMEDRTLNELHQILMEKMAEGVDEDTGDESVESDRVDMESQGDFNNIRRIFSPGVEDIESSKQASRLNDSACAMMHDTPATQNATKHVASLHQVIDHDKGNYHDDEKCKQNSEQLIKASDNEGAGTIAKTQGIASKEQQQHSEGAKGVKKKKRKMTESSPDKSMYPLFFKKSVNAEGKDQREAKKGRNPYKKEEARGWGAHC